MRAIRLETAFLTNPVGIDIINPQLFWNCDDGIKQTSYQILCRDDHGTTLWDTGKAKGDSMRVVYAGKPLKSRDRVFWQVRLWDEDDQVGDWSEEASFEIGLLNATDWQAKWITGNYKVNRKKRYPVDCFRKQLWCNLSRMQGELTY